MRWLFVDLTPGHSSLENDVEDDILDEYKDQLYVIFSRKMVEDLKGHTLTIGAEIENFLGNKGYNETTIEFLDDRKIELIDIKDIYTMNPK